MTRALIVTTPIRPVPTNFPPFGSMALLQYMRKNGIEDAAFYDIDCLRPTFDVAVDTIVSKNPKVLGISAVVSTAYRYVKQLSKAVKARLPDTLIVVGGNMGASAELLLRKCDVDICVAGEGEKVFANLVRRTGDTTNLEDFKDIPGLVFLDSQGQLVNTGYETPLSVEELYDIRWDDLREGSNIKHFFRVVDQRRDLLAMKFNNDPRVFESHRRGKVSSYLYTSKGCVSRCTFCHRWDKGLRSIPVPIVMKRLDELIENHNVGFLHIADENFGADHRWLEEFCAEIKKRDVLWTGGSRSRGVTEARMTLLKEAGCIAYGFGTESGSERILTVMEKKIGIDENYQALKVTHSLNMQAPIALVIGMPGETRETIEETIKLCQFVKSQSPWSNPTSIAINYAQALPGTPLYEYARHRGMIGQTLDGEEEYMLSISDRDAHDEFSTLNFTDVPALEAQTWRPLITIETNYHFVKTFGIDQYYRVVLHNLVVDGQLVEDSGYYANPQRLLENSEQKEELKPLERDMNSPPPKPPGLLKLLSKGRLGMAMICYPVLFHRLRAFLLLMVLIKDVQKFGPSYTLSLIGEYFRYRIGLTKPQPFEYKSLRKMVEKDFGALNGDDVAMAPLRKGR